LWKIYRWKASPFYIYTGLIFFTIVYSADHYVVDIIAGIVLAFLCFGIVLWIKRPSLMNQGQQSDIPRKADSKYRHILFGLILLALAMFLGYYVGKQFDSNRSYLNIQAVVPNYVDFFEHMQNYENHYHIQLYYGNHLIHKEEYEQALTHYKKALRLSENLQEKSQVQLRIRQCELLLKRQGELRGFLD
jgi:tetratricopeptide (TPR) repeat protein